MRVLAFARLRELLGFGQAEVELGADATIEELWTRLMPPSQTGAGLRASTRFACNGTLAEATTLLRDGDEVALMPPVGGG